MKPLSILFIGIFTAMMGYAIYRLIHNGPRPDEVQLFSIEKLAPAAKKHDPFACGQGLKLFVDNSKEMEMRDDFIKWCCMPPLDDMSGFIKQACTELLKVDPTTMPETP